MNLSPLFMEIWSFETVNCLNFNTQRQKRHDVTNDVKVNFLICGLVGCMKHMLFLANILFSSSEPKAPGELIGWASNWHTCVRPSVRPSVNVYTLQI